MLRLCVAALAGLASSVVVVGGTGVLVGGSGANGFADIDRGASIVEAKCSSCHAVDAGASSGFGPNLALIGAEAGTRRPDYSAEEYLLESLAEPNAYRHPGMEGAMPRGTLEGANEADIRAVIAYLASLGTERPDLNAVAELVIDPSRFNGEPRRYEALSRLRRGEEIFREEAGCTACHAILGEPGGSLRAPSLARAGLLPREYLRQSIREPSAVIAAGYRFAKVDLEDGTVLEGRILSETSRELELLSMPPGDRPERHEISREHVAAIHRETNSRMPPYELPLVDEIALVAFLRSLTAYTIGH